MSALKRILVTGATGKQGSAAVSALLRSTNPPFEVLALTRNTRGSAAQSLAKMANVSLIEGDLDDVSSIFHKLNGPLHGVFSVQALTEPAREEEQGKNLINAALQHKVEHFVYTSVDRGGPRRSDSNPTNIPHFRSKHNIESHLKQMVQATQSNMKWTIIRPVAFMDNFSPSFMGTAFQTILMLNGKHNKMQYVSTKSIGILVAEAFKSPDHFDGKALSLATDELNPVEMDAIFRKVTGRPMPQTFPIVAKVIRWLGRKELEPMMKWFVEEGYGADPHEYSGQFEGMESFETWLRNSSRFEKL